MEVGSIPGSFLPFAANESAPVGTIPVEAITAEAQLQIGQLREAALVADPVVRPPMDLMHADHETLVGDRGEAVELRSRRRSGIGLLRLGQVEAIRIGPVDRLRPVRPVEKPCALGVVTAPSTRAVLLDALDPFPPERIVKDRSVVSGGRGTRDGLRPGDAVGDLQAVGQARHLLVLRHVRPAGEVFDALLRIGRKDVIPERVVGARSLALTVPPGRALGEENISTMQAQLGTGPGF